MKLLLPIEILHVVVCELQAEVLVLYTVNSSSYYRITCTEIVLYI